MRRLRALASDRAATDPLLVIAAIAVSLVLLIGGGFTVSALVSNGHNVNARNDLAGVAAFESSADASGAGFHSVWSAGAPLDSLSGPAYTPSSGSWIAAHACGGGWVAAARASNGVVWWRSSASSKTAQDPAALTIQPCAAPTVTALAAGMAQKPLPSGKVTTLAGGNGPGYRDGTAGTAQFQYPWGSAADGFGSVIVSDNQNCVLRRVDGSGAVSTLLGAAGTCTQVDGPLSAARTRLTYDVLPDGHGGLYFAEQASNSIRYISPDGQVRTVTNAVDAVQGLALDRDGSILTVAPTRNQVIRVTAAGVVSVIAGSPARTAGFDNESVGDPLQATFRSPSSVTVGADGTFYVSDSGNNAIRAISPSGNVSTYAGSGTAGLVEGSKASAQFNQPTMVAVAPSGAMFVADRYNNVIRRIGTDGQVTTFAGRSVGAADGTGAAAQFSKPSGVRFDPLGNLIVTDNYNHAVRLVGTDER
ncbi:NHL domain-containing protein [Curtobacterium citreum]